MKATFNLKGLTASLPQYQVDIEEISTTFECERGEYVEMVQAVVGIVKEIKDMFEVKKEEEDVLSKLDKLSKL